MDINENAKWRLEHGNKFPYDGGEDFWNDKGSVRPAKDAAHKTARGILADLCDRRGVKHELGEVDHDVREELVDTIAEIIRVGMA